MIPDQWYAILESDEVPRDRPVGMVRLGERLVLWRDSQGNVVCQRDKCAHRGAALSKGKVVGDSVECPFHALQYDSKGRCQLIPANGQVSPVPDRFRIHTYPSQEAHGFIWLWWGEGTTDLPPLPWFEDIDGSFAHATFRDHWPVHYSRAIENQLDMAHVPFVHHNTIGRGGRTVVDGPVVKSADDRILVWVYNRKDDGSPARRSAELPEPERPAMLHFHFANVWQNRIQDDMRVVVAFAPIDESNTLLYVRNYQRFVRLPILRWFVCQGGNIGSRIITAQDKRVVTTQDPKKSGLAIGEKLFPADQPIVAYRRRRQELIEQPEDTATSE
jgi:phenylpropionate dioxygenase-like ring-hydroxylating dioxygenase large terminal subunit